MDVDKPKPKSWFDPEFNRRDFLKVAGLAATVAGGSLLLPRQILAQAARRFTGQPPDTPETKPTLSINECVPVRLCTVVWSISERTPWAKAAARVPPPENASPTRMSPPAVGFWRLDAKASSALPEIGWLMGSVAPNELHPASQTASAAAGAMVRRTEIRLSNDATPRTRTGPGGSLPS